MKINGGHVLLYPVSEISSVPFRMGEISPFYRELLVKTTLIFPECSYGDRCHTNYISGTYFCNMSVLNKDSLSKSDL